MAAARSRLSRSLRASAFCTFLLTVSALFHIGSSSTSSSTSTSARSGYVCLAFVPSAAGFSDRSLRRSLTRPETPRIGAMHTRHYEHPREEPSQPWTMEEDWALLDQLPKFSVGQGHNARTFWTQLRMATPTLSHRSERDLLQRCTDMRSEQHAMDTNAASSASNHNNNNNDNSQQCSNRSSDSVAAPSLNGRSIATVDFGPSPPLLQNWKLNVPTNAFQSKQVDGSVISGQTDHGRTVWMNVRVIGRLAGDPLASSSSFGAGAVCNMLPGGFVEVAGGRVFELGDPIRLSDTAQHLESGSSTPGLGVHPSGAVSRSEWEQHVAHNYVSGLWDTARADRLDDVRLSHDHSDKHRMGWWVPATTATVSALLASSVLSACIGYGAGLSIIADNGSTSYHHQQHAYALDSSRTMHRSMPGSSSQVSVPVTSMSTTSLQLQRAQTQQQYQPTVSEIRAKTEARILREQRMVKAINERLEQDQSELARLRQLETQQ